MWISVQAPFQVGDPRPCGWWEVSGHLYMLSGCLRARVCECQAGSGRRVCVLSLWVCFQVFTFTCVCDGTSGCLCLGVWMYWRMSV